MNPEREGILQKALGGTRLSEDDARMLMQVEGEDVLALGTTASRVRKNAVGDNVTYVLNRNINFTNICTGSCKFCAFRRDSKAPIHSSCPFVRVTVKGVSPGELEMVKVLAVEATTFLNSSLSGL